MPVAQVRDFYSAGYFAIDLGGVSIRSSHTVTQDPMSSMFSSPSRAAGSADENGVEQACNFHLSFANSKLQTGTACGTKSRTTNIPISTKSCNYIAINVMQPRHGLLVLHTQLEAVLL